MNQLTDFIGKFPEYKCAPPEKKGRRIWIDDDKRDWRVTSKEWTAPSPSVALNTRNLKSSYPAIFRK